MKINKFKVESWDDLDKHHPFNNQRLIEQMNKNCELQLQKWNKIFELELKDFKPNEELYKEFTLEQLEEILESIIDGRN